MDACLHSPPTECSRSLISARVGFWPQARRRSPSESSWTRPVPRLSKREKASLKLVDCAWSPMIALVWGSVFQSGGCVCNVCDVRAMVYCECADGEVDGAVKETSRVVDFSGPTRGTGREGKGASQSFWGRLGSARQSRTIVSFWCVLRDFSYNRCVSYFLDGGSWRQRVKVKVQSR